MFLKVYDEMLYEIFNIMESLLHSTVKFFRGAQFQDIYKKIFGTPQFPFWFLVQATWECYIVKRSQVSNANLSSKTITKTNKRKKLENKSKIAEKENKSSENNDENSNEKLIFKSTDPDNENSNEKNKSSNELNNETEASRKREPLISLRKILDFILCYILCFSMNFLQRELFALLFKMPSPIKKNSHLIIIFTLVFVLIFCLPFDILFKIIHFKPFSFILGFLQGANQTRFFKLTLRHATKSLLPTQYVPTVAGFLVFDFFIEFFFSPLFNRKGRSTSISNGSVICDNIVFCIIYLILTIPNKISRDFLHGMKINDMYAAFFLVVTLGLYNAINAVKNDRKSRK